jgi:hypothetical protein
MAFLTKLFNFYLNASIHVAIAVWCLVQMSQNESANYANLVFFGTLISYNYLKHHQNFGKNNLLQFQNISLLLVTLTSFFAFAYYFLQLNNTIQKQLILSGFFVLSYPFIRSIGWAKLFFVSFVVSYVTVFIPSTTFSFESFFTRFFLLSALMIPFEINDSTTDSTSLKTLPQLFGIAKTKQIGYILCFASFYFSFCTAPKNDMLPSFNMLFYLLVFASIYFSSTKKTKYYTLFWVESVPIIWWLTLYFQP